MSGLFWNGTPARILDSWRQRRWLARNISRIFARRRGDDGFADAAEFVEFYAARAESVIDVPLQGPVCRDPDDDKFIACALAAKASFVVTGDRALLAVSRFGDVSMVTPKRFLEELSD